MQEKCNKILSLYGGNFMKDVSSSCAVHFSIITITIDQLVNRRSCFNIKIIRRNFSNSLNVSYTCSTRFCVLKFLINSQKSSIDQISARR